MQYQQCNDNINLNIPNHLQLTTQNKYRIVICMKNVLEKTKATIWKNCDFESYFSLLQDGLVWIPHKPMHAQGHKIQLYNRQCLWPLIWLYISPYLNAQTSAMQYPHTSTNGKSSTFNPNITHQIKYFSTKIRWIFGIRNHY